MTDFGDFKPTGRKTSGPSSDLVEVEGSDGGRQTVILYNDAYHSHSRLTTAVELVQSFMEFPMVTGLVDMTRAGIGEGLFQYDTGPVMPLFDLLRWLRTNKQKGGIRAGIELCIAVGSALHEAAENGPPQGIYSSSGLTPWRIVLDTDGEPSVIGYGLPQIEIHELRENKSYAGVREDSLKYCPPERLVSGHEDISTDLYSLALIAYELMTGKALLAGKTKALEKKVKMGEACQILLQTQGGIPAAVHNLLVQALAFDPISRFEESIEFVEGMQSILDGKKIDGPSLQDIMAKAGFVVLRGEPFYDRL